MGGGVCWDHHHCHRYHPHHRHHWHHLRHRHHNQQHHQYILTPHPHPDQAAHEWM